MAQTNAAFPTIKYEGKDWSGLTSANNLAALFGERPIMVSNMLDTIYKVNLQDDLISKINSYPILYLADDREYQWMLMGADSKNIPLIRATDLAGAAFNAASRPGQYGARFYMFFPEQLFFQTHVIVGEKPDLYHILLRSEGVQVGTSFRYECELLTGNRDLYIPFAELAAGTRWSVDYSIAEQFMGKKGSGISFTSPFLMSNRISHLRKEYTVPGEMILKGQNEPVSFNWQYGADGGSTKTFKTWINRVDFEFDKAFRREKARLLFFGKSNRTEDGKYLNLGDAGGEIKAGLGLREQISPANVFNYTTFNIETLVDFALSLSVGKLPEDQRHFVIGTGEHGLKMISRAIEQYAGAQALEYNRITGITGGKNASFQRPQFVKYADINGISFEFIHIPWYDDYVRNKVYHPDQGLVESYRLTIMDFGTSSGQPNVQQVRIKGQDEVFGYTPGLRDPYQPGGGRTSPKLMVSKVDGYEITRADWCGIKVHNPLRMGEWIPAIY
jgi:hypothetical protein